MEIENKNKSERALTYFEIDVSILIHIECPKNVIAKLFGVARWKEHLVHIYEFGWS